MFVNIVQFPRSRTKRTPNSGSGSEDLNWAHAKHPGFIRWILLQPREGGNYVAIVEHESYETFMAMHTSSTQADFLQRVQAIFEGIRDPTFYDVVTG